MNSIEKIKHKIKKGERLVKEDGLFLLKSNDLLSMGRLADAEKQKKTKNNIFFNINCHVNITNVCVARCSFCAFSRDKGDDGAYEMSREDIVNKIRASLNTGITEVHIVSGLHPDKPFDFYVDVLKEIHNEFPSIHIKAFTPVEIKYFSDISGMSIKDVLVKLKDTGLGSMPGGGAEVLSGRVRQELCPNKATADDWLKIMEIAHLLGLKTNATLLYGHIETKSPAFFDILNYTFLIYG